MGIVAVIIAVVDVGGSSERGGVKVICLLPCHLRPRWLGQFGHSDRLRLYQTQQYEEIIRNPEVIRPSLMYL